MAAPAITGFTMIRDLARDPDFGLPIFLHPCFSGPLVLSQDAGISPFCYYGQLSRLAGADAVIFTSFGGRFSFSQDTCQKIAEGTESKMDTTSGQTSLSPPAACAGSSSKKWSASTVPIPSSSWAALFRQKAPTSPRIRNSSSKSSRKQWERSD